LNSGNLGKFFAELKRRNVYKVAVAYAVVGWLLEPDEMFKWLGTAYAMRDSGLTQLAVTLFFLPHREDSRFIALCQKLNVHVPSVPAKQ